MNLSNIKKIHIVGIGGCASSAIAQYLSLSNIFVTGSERKERSDLGFLSDANVKFFFKHDKDNLYYNEIRPDYVLYSPAVKALDPNNPELLEAEKNNIPTLSWENFIGQYLNTIGKIGVTISGSEGKGTTGGILTHILKGTSFDPIVFLGAQLKHNDRPNSNIYIGNGKSYILEGDEYNHNFFGYHPSINVTVNFKYEHPETYKDFDDYKKSFVHFFTNMNGENHTKTLIFRATNELKDLVNEYNLDKTHKIVWFGSKDEISNVNGIKYEIANPISTRNGNTFQLIKNENGKVTSFDFKLNFTPRYIIYNAVGAIIAAFELGLDYQTILSNINNFTGMVRRFDVKNTKSNGAIITDYGHSPESINCIVGEIRNLYPENKLHLIFHPHLFSRTFAFFDGFVDALSKADKISVVDIYPAREKIEDWQDKISSKMIVDKLLALNKDAFYVGKSSEISKKLQNRINPDEISCFIGAGDMDLHYNELIEQFTK